jgi:polysaccharide export outer membrane protein
MGKSYLKRGCLIIQVLFLTLSFISCSTTKKVKYFQDIPDSGVLKTLPAAVYHEHKIQPHDVLTIYFQTIDPSATSAINSGNLPSGGASPTSASSSGSASSLSGLAASIGQGGNTSSSNGYEVGDDGNIELPYIGKLSVVGHTTSEVKDIVQAAANKYFVAPTIIVKFSNFNVTILGEVLRPGAYTMGNEKTSILDAIATAGDLTIFGKRENVLLIRENLDGTKKVYRVNLKKSDIISAPYFYLCQNDVIYVEPMKSKAAATDAAQARTYTIIGAALSVLVILATRIK